MDIQNVKQISDVAKIKLSDKELEEFSNELDKLLSYFSKVQSIDTAGIKENNYMHDLKNTFREDEVKESDEDTKQRIRNEFTKENENLLLAPKSLK
jgi:aspartyl-tRNA(Asn)/glutamyl-tRNA(Gln) amidotransferase subunit C